MDNKKDIEQKISQKLETTSEKPVNEEDTKRIEQSIPLLATISQEDRKSMAYQKLIKLMIEMSHLKYDPSQKYEQMYKIIEIGNLMELLLPEDLQLKVDATTIKSISDLQKFPELNFYQQWSIFKIARNMSADGFHNLYEDQTKLFIENFSNLCNGLNMAKFFGEEHTFYNALKKNIEKKNVFSLSTEGHESLEKLFNQTVYFLSKAKELMKIGNAKGAYMALIAAGNCARDFNRSGLNQVKVDSIMLIITNIRLSTAHSYTKDFTESKLLMKIQQVASEESINKLILDLAKEVSQYNVKIAVEPSSKKNTSIPGSPRAFRQNVVEQIRHEAISKKDPPQQVDLPVEGMSNRSSERGAFRGGRGRSNFNEEMGSGSYRGGSLRGASESRGRGEKERESIAPPTRGSVRGNSESRGRGGRGRGRLSDERESTIPTRRDDIRSFSEEREKEEKKTEKESAPKLFSSHEEHKLKPFRREDHDKGGGRGFSSKDTRFSSPSSANLGSGVKETKSPSNTEGTKTKEHKSSAANNTSQLQDKEIKSNKLVQTYNSTVGKPKTWKTPEDVPTKDTKSPPLSSKSEDTPTRPEIRLKSLTQQKPDNKPNEESSGQKPKEGTNFKM